MRCRESWRSLFVGKIEVGRGVVGLKEGREDEMEKINRKIQLRIVLLLPSFLLVFYAILELTMVVPSAQHIFVENVLPGKT